ncbi:YkvA family protein [Glycomyces arizonensis]|uniref:YkvA family protein n=1 Tax=Glycomyces arizonensis TaxID=256035 RepID=UPI00041CDB07|nr:DUF1232 domain-containing protein [Glycomyces arizonensis]
MAEWLIGPAALLLLVVAGWALLVLLARRLPPGLLRDLAAFIPDCVTTVRRLKGHPAVPRRAKVVVVLAGVYLASPIDLIPEFLPVIGPLDDVVVVALALRYAARSVPPDVILAAWPGERRLIDLLIGVPRDVSGN